MGGKRMILRGHCSRPPTYLCVQRGLPLLAREKPKAALLWRGHQICGLIGRPAHSAESLTTKSEAWSSLPPRCAPLVFDAFWGGRQRAGNATHLGALPPEGEAGGPCVSMSATSLAVALFRQVMSKRCACHASMLREMRYMTACCEIFRDAHLFADCSAAAASEK